MSEKSKEQDTANQLAGLHISDKSPSPEMRPPRPPRPVQQPPEEEEDEDDFEEEDENDPFADRNAVTTPKAERFEPVWYVIFQVHSNHDNQRRNIGELFDPFLLR
jgi:LAS seventeen-binding protein 5